jgi:hypothetical protein
MIPYNIQPGTQVRNIKTGTIRTYEGRVSVNGSTPKAHLSGLRATRWETFASKYELANQTSPLLMTSI